MVDTTNTLTLTDSQQATLSIAPTDRKGKPAQVEGVTWTSSDNTKVTVEPAPDGLSAVIKAQDIGTAQVSVGADAQLGDGVTALTGLLNVEVVAGAAVSLGIAAGAPTEQP